MSKKILSCVLVALMASVSFGAIEAGPATDTGVNLIYTPDTGDLMFESRAGAVTTFELKSAAGNFTTAAQPLLGGLFDVNSAVKKFKLEPNGFESLNLTGAVKTGLSFDALAADLTLDGSFAAGGALSTVPNILVVPEPSSLALIAFGLLGVLGIRRK
jgi:hypothetical protein